MVSFVLATYNRAEVVADTVTRLRERGRIGLRPESYEIIVVDNASTDDTVARLRVRSTRRGCDAEGEGGSARAGTAPLILLEAGENLGSCAKALGVARARGAYVVFLDDDSHPQVGTITRMLEHFAADAKLGAAGFRVHLPNGHEECSALPGVFVGCGVGFRAEALRAAGGLDLSFFMQAEEYDLAFRLVASGWNVRRFADLHVDHLKTAQARQSPRTVFHDTRNNLRVVARYLPQPYAAIYRQDWQTRYGWLAERAGQVDAYQKGRRAGRRLGLSERRRFRRHRLDVSALEGFFRLGEIRTYFYELAQAGMRYVVLADLGKNIFAYYYGARCAGLEILAIADDRFARQGRRYRGVPIVPCMDALSLPADAIVVSNTSYVHAAETKRRLTPATRVPVLDWFAFAGTAEVAGSPLAAPQRSPDSGAVAATADRKGVAAAAPA
jgi:GT2 family glycosyltransferase